MPKQSIQIHHERGCATKTDFLLSGTVLLTLLALACPWQAAAEAEGQEKKLLVPAQAIDTSCEAFLKRNKISGIRDCAVSETGTIGRVDGQTYDYALYCLIADYQPAAVTCGDHSHTAQYNMYRGLSIFTHEASGKQIKMLLERCDPNIGNSIYLQPAIVTNSFGTLLHVYIEMDGSGHDNESEYYLWKKKPKGWMLLDSTEWMDNLLKKIPPDLYIHKGVWPDLKTMTVTAGLRCRDWDKWDYDKCSFSGEGDNTYGNALATGKLTVKHGKFVVNSVKIE